VAALAVDAERGHTAPPERGGQPAGAAPEVERGAAAAVEHPLVGRVRVGGAARDPLGDPDAVQGDGPARTLLPDGGAGLGLAIARGIVEAHAGRLAVTNTTSGCRFEVRLPRLDAVG